MKGKEKNFFRCPLCGNIFQKETHGCAKGCPFRKTCDLVCCPRCHYQFVEESKTVQLLKRIFGKARVEKEADR